MAELLQRKPFLRVCLHGLLLLCVVKLSHSLAGCSFSIAVDASSPADGGCTPSPSHLSRSNLTCNKLRDALTSASFSGESICISMGPGVHYVDYTTTEIEYNVHISSPSDGGEARVECDPNAAFNSSTYDQFPLIFGNDISVLLERVTFARCGRSLLFNGTAEVRVSNCHFSNFTQTALEIYNTPSVTITGSTFTNNTCRGQGPLRNSGNAGGVSIGYNDTYPATNTPIILIKNCTFINNEARLITSDDAMSSNNCSGPNPALSQKIFFQRGGAIGCYFSSARLQSVVTISGSVFTANLAEDSGGAIYMNLNGEDGSATNISISDCHFTRNWAMHGAGVEITFDTPESVWKPNHLTIDNCTFTGNAGFQGGAIKLPQLSERGNLNYITISGCVFTANTAETGASLHIQTFLTGLLTDPVDTTRRIHINSSTFVGNVGRRGVTFFSFNHVNFGGFNLFTNNTGPSLRVRGSMASIEGNMSFTDNRNHPEGLSGTMFVSSFSQVLLNPGVDILFLNNTGQEGAAIVVQTPRISSGFARTLFNPQCFLQFYNSTKPPINWSEENVNMKFEGNQAAVGPSLFISNLNACSWYNLSGEYFNINIDNTWDFMESTDSTAVGREEGSEELYIQTQLATLAVEPPNTSLCYMENDSLSPVYCAYAGESFLVFVRALDQLNHSTSEFLEISVKETGVQFTPSIVRIQATDDNITLHYHFDGATTTNQDLTVYIEPAFSSANVSATFTLRPISCPPGFTLFPHNTSCECDDKREILSCDNENMKFVLLNDGLWGAPPDWSRHLLTYPCPPEYCNCMGPPNDLTTEGCALIYDSPYDMCTPHRQGILCGECEGGYGVGVLESECRKFSGVNSYYWLIPILILFVIVAVVMIVKLGVVIPYTLLGFLFYIQVSSLAVESFNEPLGLEHHVMGFFNSLFSLYVPYDFSVRSGLTSLEAFGLRYISPLLALLVAPIAMRIRYHPRSWNGVWTLVLLMYGMAAQTSSSLMFCPTFTARDISGNTQTITVWFYDGSVTCFHRAHLPLALLSLLSLIILALLVPALALIAYHTELSTKYKVLYRRWLERVSLSLTAPFHPHARWWLPLELLRRLVFILSVVFCPGYVSLPLLEAGVLLMAVWFVRPYKDWRANATESFSLSVLVLVLCLGNTNPLVTAGRTVMELREKRLYLWPIFYLPLAVGGEVNEDARVSCVVNREKRREEEEKGHSGAQSEEEKCKIN